MRGLGQIAFLARSRGPTSRVITNVGPVHLELVETIENVARAKAELIDALPPGGIAVVPQEPLLEPYLTRDDIGAPVRRVEEPGFASERDPFATSYSRRATSCTTRGPRRRRRVLGLPLPDGELHVEFSSSAGRSPAAGRRPPAQRLLQREPGLDARRARAPRRARAARTAPPRGAR